MKNQNGPDKKSCKKKAKWAFKKKRFFGQVVLFLRKKKPNLQWRASGFLFLCVILPFFLTLYVRFFQNLSLANSTFFFELRDFLDFFCTKILNTSVNQTVFNDSYLLDYNFEFSLLCNHLHINLEKMQNLVFFKFFPFVIYFSLYSVFRKKITPFLNYLTNQILAYKDILWYFDTLATFFNYVSSKKPLYNSFLIRLPRVFLELSQIINQKLMIETFLLVIFFMSYKLIYVKIFTLLFQFLQDEIV